MKAVATALLLSALVVCCVADATKPVVPNSFRVNFVVRDALSQSAPSIQMKVTYSLDVRKYLMENFVDGQLMSGIIMSDNEQTVKTPANCFTVPSPTPSYFDSMNIHLFLDAATYAGEETYNGIVCDKWTFAQATVFFNKQGKPVNIHYEQANLEVVSFEELTFAVEDFAIPASWQCSSASLRGKFQDLMKKLVSPRQ
eukprot:GILK01001067.1.p1 GENE.GILK01001067.1~~GILK01001067.1.p1  ORF type:complete len:214 (-),score=41.76 GILK01001067.1:77-670(-)